MSVDVLYYIIGTNNGFVPVHNQILWHLLLVIGHNWLKLGIYFYVSFRISYYLYVDADRQLLFAQTDNGRYSPGVSRCSNYISRTNGLSRGMC